MSNEELSQTEMSEAEQVATGNDNVQKARNKITGRQIPTVLVSSTSFFYGFLCYFCNQPCFTYAWLCL